MADEMVTWLLAIPVLGFATGLRTMTPIAVLCWYAWRGGLSIHHTWAFWTAKPVAAIVFTVLAIGELAADKHPSVPDRISPGPLAARLVFAGLCGAIAAASLRGPGLEGVILAVIGALIGAFGGFMVRRHMTSNVQCPDWTIALSEDAVAIVSAIVAVNVIAS